MTWGMYQQLGDICAQLAGDDSVRVVVFRGAGGKAFVAGTDIAQFLDFKSGDDGMGYEEQMEAILGGLETLPMPTLAVVEGWAIGGGLAIAACCDLCVATPGSRFGVPIARTLGNCLSVANTARLVASLGVSRTKRVLLLAEMIRRRGSARGRLPHRDHAARRPRPPRRASSATGSLTMRRSRCGSARKRSAASCRPDCPARGPRA